ncbi:MAG: hypothetical protein IT285_01705 [Bdellovibrionales bacterium]|nr:hypothetical protein [Bdellovibrionales bacterium]
MSDVKKPSSTLKGVPADASPEMRQAADDFVGFLKDPNQKQALTDFIVKTYREYESERVGRLQAQIEHEHEIDSQRLAPFHQSGNITPMVAKDLGMAETEAAFARSLRHTHKSLIKTVEDRVEETNRLLAGIGGFSSQLKSCFARSTVVFLEQDDPRHSYRERLVFSIHLPHYELKRSWADAPAAAAPRAMKPGAGPSVSPGARRDGGPGDGRTPMQATWDDAVNALAAIIQSAGLKPKYCKNDRNYGRFVMKQDLQTSHVLPDEYFSLTLDYNTNEKIREMGESYNKVLRGYDKKIEKLEPKLSRWPKDSNEPAFLTHRKRVQGLINERNYFVATVPDPNQLEEGLLFLIEVSTLKDYHIVKDRMQSIMTKFILHLSKIAENQANFDPDLQYELWKSGTVTGKSAEALTQEDEMLEGVTEYVVDEADLRKLAKKKAA